jgi:hypothetical protein
LRQNCGRGAAMEPGAAMKSEVDSEIRDGKANSA